MHDALQMMHIQVILRNILCKRKKKIQKERQQRELRQEMHTQRQYGENTTEAKTSSNTMLSFLSSSLQPTSVVAIKAFNQIIRRKHQKKASAASRAAHSPLQHVLPD